MMTQALGGVAILLVALVAVALAAVTAAIVLAAGAVSLFVLGGLAFASYVIDEVLP